MASLRRVVVLGGGLLLSVGCAGLNEIDPPPLPPMATPVVDDARMAPKQNQGRVLVDAVGSSAKVEEVTSLEVGFEGQATTHGIKPEIALRPLCPTTPCAADLGYGIHILRFSRPESGKSSFASFEITSPRSAVRHDLGYYETHPTRLAIGGAMQTTGIVFASIGTVLFLAGVTPLGDVIGADDTVTEVQDGLKTAGLAMGLSGLGVLIGGIVLKALSRDEYQKGSTSHWALPATQQPPPPPANEPPPAPASDAGATPMADIPYIDASAPSLPVPLGPIGDAGAPDAR